MNRDHVVKLPRPGHVQMSRRQLSGVGCKHGDATQAICTGRFSRRGGLIEHLAGEGSQNRGLCYIHSASSTQTPATVTLPGHGQAANALIQVVQT